LAENEALRKQISAMSTALADVVAPLDDRLLGVRAATGVNPAGFIYWHVLRVWDRNLNVVILGMDPDMDAWHRAGFSEASGYEPYGKGVRGAGIGNGFSDAEVDEVPYRARWLRSYHEQALTETTAYLTVAGRVELGREIALPRRRHTSPAACLQLVVRHGTTHITELRRISTRLGVATSESRIAPAVGER
jgi:hypothetical protein